MASDLTLIVTYTHLTPESEQAMATWRQLCPDTWCCRLGVAGSPAEGRLPDSWAQLPDQPDASAVGRIAVGYGEGAWLLVVDAGDQPDPAAWRNLTAALPGLDPGTVYLLAVPISNRLVDIQPRLLHRLGAPGGSPASDLGLQMALLPFWPLLGSSSPEAWIGIQDADPLIRRLVGGDVEAVSEVPDPMAPDLPTSLRLLLADDDRLHGEMTSAWGWLQPILAGGPPAVQGAAGLICKDQGRFDEALVYFHRGWLAETLITWPGYYPRSVADRRLVALALAECYHLTGSDWEAALFGRLAETPDPDRQGRVILGALAEQGDRGAWDSVVAMMARIWTLGEQADGWRRQLALGGVEAALAESAIWVSLETAGLKDKRGSSILRKAGKSFPDDPRPWYQLGSQAMVEERWPDAVAAWKTALRIQEGAGWVWNSLGVAQVRLGQLSTADTSFSRALTATESDPTAERNLAELRRMMAAKEPPVR